MGRWGSCIAVSYTHLDVYKRQVFPAQIIAQASVCERKILIRIGNATGAQIEKARNFLSVGKQIRQTAVTVSKDRPLCRLCLLYTSVRLKLPEQRKDFAEILGASGLEAPGFDLFFHRSGDRHIVFNNQDFIQSAPPPPFQLRRRNVLYASLYTRMQAAMQ